MTDLETHHVAQAAAALGDEYATGIARLREIEQALKFDEDPERRARLKRDLLASDNRKGRAA